MNKKKTIIIVAGICAIVLIAAVAAVFTVNSNKSAGADGDISVEDDSSSEKNETGADKDEDEGTVGNNEGAADSALSGSGGIGEEGAAQQWEEKFFPYAIDGTALVVQNISSYDGIFLEDGSDGQVTGVAAMVVENTGDTNVEYAAITINCNGEILEFDASDIPAGATIVVQEKNKTAYQSGTYADCSAVVAEMGEFEMSADQVKVEETENGSLLVTNLTDEEIPCVRIFYKFYMEEEEAYVGGITYTAKLTGLSAGGSQTVSPSHYAAGSSRVMMVRTYDSAE